MERRSVRRNLTTERLLLRPLTIADLEAVHRYAGSYENLFYTAWGPNTEKETLEFLQSAEEDERRIPRRNYHFGIVVRTTGELVGGCGIDVEEGGTEAEIGWVLRSDCQRQGYGTEAAQAILRFGFEDLHLHRIIAVCRSDNYGSYRVMERNGMRREGVFLKKRMGRLCDPEPWYDEIQYAILAEEWSLDRMLLPIS